MSPADEPTPDKAAPPEALPPGVPSNEPMMAAAAHVVRMHQEILRQSQLRASVMTLGMSSPLIQKALDDRDAATMAHYAAIGRVAATWAYFEAVVDTWLHHFAGLPTAVGVCFTAQMIGPRPRTDAFIALVRQLGADKRWNKILEDFGKDAQVLGEKRNRAVHDVWDLKEPEKPQRLEATARRTVRVLTLHEPTETLIKIARDIEALRERFDDKIASPIFTELHTLRDKPAP